MSSSVHTAQLRIAPISFLRTFALQNLGAYDPTATLSESHFSKAFATENGVCVTLIKPVDGGVVISCEGPDAEPILEELKVFFQTHDGHDTFLPEHALLKRLRQEQRGLRLLRAPWLFDVACGAILQQRVRFIDAIKDWRQIALKHGVKTTSGAVAFPSPPALAGLPPWELEALGIDPKRARSLIALAREIRLNPLRSQMTFSELRARLGRVPGIGPWTVETTLGFGAGDTDALPLGDLYLPHLVSYTLAGEPSGTDERMVELLEPYRGHRFRVVRLLFGARITIPRSGPSTRRRSSL